MADNNDQNAGELTVSQRKGALPAQRITETEFQTRPSEWLRQASSGRQIIVVDEKDRNKIKMVVGMNGVVFEGSDPLSETDQEREAKAKKGWLE